MRGKCRNCKKPISALYPFIELLTAVIFTSAYLYIPMHYYVGYGLFFSALIVTIRSDLHTMLISRFATLFLIPAGIALSFLGLLPLSPIESIIGAVAGYLFLYVVSTVFTFLTGKSGIGQGDIDLLAFIGSFCGLFGCWASILIGSIAGSIIGICYLLIARPKQPVKIPFGPFLAGGALLFVFFEPLFIQLLVGR